MLNNLNIDKSTTSFEFNGITVNVLKYLDIKSRNDLINITLQKCKEDNIYNEVLMDAYLKTYAAFLYTDVVFTDEEKQDILNTYDILASNNFIDIMIETIGEQEWADLESELYQVKYNYEKTNNSVMGAINALINTLPQNAKEAEEIMKNFDADKFQNVLNFATAANGGRSIFGNLPVAEEDNITPIG